jgi:hypothetical protein
VIADAIALTCAGLMPAWWIARFAPRHASRIAAGVLLLCLVPVGEGLILGGYLRGFVGDASLVNAAFLLSELGPGRWRLPDRSRAALLAFAIVATLLLIPFSHGLTMVDPYAWGYDGPVPALLVTVVAGWFWTTGRRPAAWILVLSLGGLHAGLLESSNAWDYVVDPMLALQATAALLIRRSQRLRAAPEIA